MSDANKQDIYCPSPLLDPSLFPTGSANFLNPNFDILPFLCQLLQVANDESVDPILSRPPEFDLTPFTDFSILDTVGDPRASLGLALSATFVYFLPRIITQTEILQSGGSQIIDNYICDPDGQPIKESKTINALLSLDLSGKKPFKYGALEIPPITDSLEELLRPITPEEVKEFVSTFVQGSRNNNAEYFIQFLKTWFLFDSRWRPSLHLMLNGSLFFVKLEFYENATSTSYQKSLYLKYYEDEKHQLACLLNIPNILLHQGDVFGNISLSKAIGAQIFNYKEIVSKPLDEQQQFYNSLIENFVVLKTQEYNIQDLFNPTLPTSAYQSMFSALTSQYFTPDFYTVQNLTSSIPLDISQCSV